MKKIFILIATFVLLSGCSTTKNGISFKIVNKNIKANEFIEVEFNNKTKTDYFLPINMELYDFLNYLEDDKLKCFYFGYLLLEDSNEIPTINTRKSNCLDSIYSINSNKLYFKKENEYIIKANSKLKLSIPFNDTIRLNKCDNLQYYKFDKKKKYYLQIVYDFRNVDINKFAGLEKFRKDCKLFNGRIVSNKIPIIF